MFKLNLDKTKMALIVVVSAAVHLLVGLGLIYLNKDYALTIAMMLVNVALLVIFVPLLM